MLNARKLSDTDADQNILSTAALAATYYRNRDEINGTKGVCKILINAHKSGRISPLKTIVETRVCDAQPM